MQPRSIIGRLMSERIGTPKSSPAVISPTPVVKPVNYSVDKNARDKVRGMYELVQSRGLYIAPELDIQFGDKKSIPLNNNGSETLVLADENYNSNLLFTILSCLNPVSNPAMIFFGPPGAGKTTCAEYVGHFMFNLSLDEIHNATIYGHPEQTEEKMVARYNVASLMQGKELVEKREFITSPVRIVDEVNRLPPGKLSILYQIVDTGLAKYGSEVMHLAEGPLFATANAPDSGNFPLPPPFKDRFEIAVISPELNPYFITSLGRQNLSIPSDLEVRVDTLLTARNEIARVEVDPDILNKLSHFISEINYCEKAGTSLERKTKSHSMNKKPGEGLCSDCHYKSKLCAATKEPISPRSYKAILGYSRALAWFRGKSRVDDETLEAVLPFALWHKLEPTPAGLELEAVYENDRVAFVKALYDASKKSFTQVSNSITGYDEMMRVISSSYDPNTPRDEIRKKIEGFLDSLKSIDSVQKFPLAVALKSAYVRLQDDKQR